MIDRSNIAELLAIVSTTSGSKTTLCLKYSQTPIKQKDLRKSSTKEQNRSKMWKNMSIQNK